MLSLNSSNCWKPLRATHATTQLVMTNVNAEKGVDCAISSEAARKLVERSTTRKSNLTLDAMVKFPRTGSACFIFRNIGDMIQCMERRFFATAKELEDKYKELGSMDKVALFFNVSKKLILRYMKRYGISTNRTKVEEGKFVRPLIISYVEQGKTTKEIADIFGKSTVAIRKYIRDLGLKSNDYFHKGYTISHNGYKMVIASDHPCCDSKGYVREHRLVIENYLQRYLDKDEIVHHKDENKLNNDISNLEVMSKADHVKLHKPQRRVNI